MMMRLPSELKIRQPESGQVRIPFMRTCRIAEPSSEQAGLVCDLSVGGVYVRLQHAIEPGTRVRVSFELFSGDKPVVLDAEVRWQNAEDVRRVPALPPGCGLRFLEAQERTPIAAVVKTYSTPFAS